MNITERIVQVLEQHGMNKSELARRMSKHNQQVNRLIENPKWETIESVCSAIGIKPWQLFEQEFIDAGYHLPTDESASVERQKADNKQLNADEQPMTAEAPQTVAVTEPKIEVTTTVRFHCDCPACGEHIRISIEKV